MKFRPLCIDYHARAQEIIITERDYNSRRAAQSLLSHRPSELSPRHHDDDTIDQSLGLNDEDEENRKPSNSLLNSNVDGNVDHRKYHPVDTSKSNERQATRREGSIANAPRSSAHGNRSITAVFGPTIPPSECALRKISPVTRGPIRGRLLPVVETVPAMESIIGLHAKIGEEIFQRGIFSSLGGGGESCQHKQKSFIDDAAMFLQSGYTTVDHPMQIMDETNNSDDNAAVDTIELTNAPYSPPYKLLRHEPEDLTKIQSLKSLQISNVANFASEVIKLMEPRRSSSRRKTTECGLHKVGKERTTLSAKPKLSITSCEQMTEMYNNDFAPNKNVLSLTSFYEDCHGGLDDCRSPACPILQSRKLKPYAEDQFFMVRLDPDFDPSSCQSTSSSEKMDSAGLVCSLGEICNAAFISRELALPRRLEHESDVQIARILHSSCSSVHKVDFVEESLNRFKESQKRDEALLTPFVQRSDLLIGESRSFPKKIALESDLSLYDDDSIEPGTPICQADTALTLPSFVQSLPFSCARKTTIRRSKPQKRFVDSSARVFKIDALSNICGPSKVACLYLPQIEVRDWKDRTSQNDLPSPEEQQHLALNDDLISFARECVPSSAIPASIDSLDGVDLLQGQTSSYPILSWFTCDDDIDESERIDHVYVDQAARDLKRRSFCSNAVKVGDKERSRCVLLTGCSSRINSGRLYSYRGFLTNQIMNPRIFQRRYISMVELNKIYQRKNISALSKGSDTAVSPRQRSFYFSRMVVVDFADGFAAKMSKKKLKQKQGKSNIRGGPFVASLKTRRHGDRLPLQPIKKNRVAVMSGMQSAVAPELEYLSSSSFHWEKDNISVNDVVGQLGRENLNVRGELLHLATKAHELKEEEDAYLAELAVINRCREDTPSRASFEDEICDRVDIDVASGACGNGKREASGAIATEEHDQEKKKKKRKKDKKKKEKKKLKKQKKSHKRKRRDAQSDRALTEKLVGDGCDISSECEETKLQVKSVKKLRIDEAVPSTTRKPWKAVPSIALGITPIHRPKEKRSQPQPSVEMHNTPKVTDERDRLDKNSTSHSLSSLESSKSGKSPDSVAVANLAHEALFTKATPKNFPMMQSQALDEDNYIVREHDGDSISAIDTDNYRSTESFNDDISFERTPEENVSTFTILTSESFLELFGESIMELASGRWFNTLTTAEKLQINSLLNCNQDPGNGLDPGTPPQAKINVSDCPLLDIAGADIELADDKALIVQRISTLTQSSKEFMKRLVTMAASGRYRSIHVILCVDTDMRPSEIVTMQNALMQQSGCPCETVTFEYTSPRTLSSSIALQFCNSSEVHKSSRISQFASDENVQERARFLICLVPTMTVHTALKCLWCADSSGRFEDEFDDDCGATAMQTLLSLARETSRELFPHKVTSMMAKACAEQLWLAVNTASSFATRQFER